VVKLYCVACSQRIDADDLCPHRNPVCWGCCADEHATYYDDPESAA
jgi:hypothetical protein